MEITCENCIYYTIGDRRNEPDKPSCTHPISMKAFEDEGEYTELYWCTSALDAYCIGHSEFVHKGPVDYQEVDW